MRKFPLELMSRDVDENDIFVRRTHYRSWTPEKNYNDIGSLLSKRAERKVLLVFHTE